MRKTITVAFLVFLLFCCPKPLLAQQGKITPLHQFFQDNYDSTIIYHNWSSWYLAPNYIIIAKQKQNLYLFTYTSPYRKLQGRPIPGDLKKLYSEEESKFQKTIPDTNRYLLALNIRSQDLQKTWKQLNIHELWKIKSNRGDTANNCIVEDGDENTFFLITETGIKITEFYSPSTYEECAGKNPDRQKAIQAIEVLVGALNETN